MPDSLPYATSVAALVVTKDLLLDLLEQARGPFNPVDGLILLGVLQANVASLLTGPEQQLAFGRFETVPPDEVRRPIKITGLAAATGLPFETVRRRTIRLAEAGACTITPSGVLVPQRHLATPSMAEAISGFDRILQDAYGRLVALHFFDGHPLPTARHDTGASAPLRAGARIAADYLLRLMPLMGKRFGGVVRALIVMQLIRENTQTLGDVRNVYEIDSRPPWVPDALKRPASVTQVASRLRLQNETVRRHMRRLAQEGMIAQVGRGYIVTAEALVDAGIPELIDENNLSLRRLYRALALVGAVRTWDAPKSA